LQDLDLSDNVMEMLPLVLCQMKLQRLNISGNQRLEVLPAQIGQLPLKELNVSRTKITQLPADFSLLSGLETLVLSNLTIAPDSTLEPSLEMVKEIVTLARSCHHPMFTSVLGQLAKESELYAMMIVKEGGIDALLSYARSDIAFVRTSAVIGLCNLSAFANVPQQMVDAGVLPPLLKCLQDQPGGTPLVAHTLTVLRNIAWIEGTQQLLLEIGALPQVWNIALDPLQNTQARAIALATVGNIALDLKCVPAVRDVCTLEILQRLADEGDADMFIQSRRLQCILGLHDMRPFKTRGLRILSMDGGGTRGVVIVEVLRAIERITGRRIYELFDLIGGTSTGGLVACGLGVRHFPLDQCDYIYKVIGKKVFVGSGDEGTAWQRLKTQVSNVTIKELSRYPLPSYEQLLNNFMGSSPLIDTSGEVGACKVFLTATITSQTPPMTYLFRNYCYALEHQSKYAGNVRYPVWKACRASSAAPSYFPELEDGKLRIQDGGILANNPVAIAVHEARKLYPNVPIDCVVSIGTGMPADAISTVNDRLLVRIMTALILSATDTEGVHNAMLETMPENQYYRFNPVHAAFDCELDETSDSKLDAMQEATREYLAANSERLNQLCEILMRQ